MAGVADAETESAYAWGALDYDDPDEFPTQPTRMTPRRITSLGLAASLVLIAVAGVVALVVFRQPGSPHVAASAAPTATVVLPDEPPPNSGCSGAVIGHSDVKHPQLGMVRVFLFLDKLQSTGPHFAGCALPVTHTGKVLPAIAIDAFVGDGFGFANPATDATGNMFIKYLDSSNFTQGGLVVLIPSADGFEHVVSYQQMPEQDGYPTGENDYYGAELIGPADGVYSIRQSANTCKPYCAAGNLIMRNLHWNGREYVPDAVPVVAAPTPTAAASSGPTIGDVCHDRMKFATDPVSGQEMICDNYSGVLNREPLRWFSAEKGAVGPDAGAADLPRVGRVGGSCDGEVLTTQGRSSDGYVVWCNGGPGSYMPDTPAPIWIVFHP